MKAAILLKHISLSDKLLIFSRKKDIPKDLRNFNPILASFGIWGYKYVIPGQYGLMLKNGEQMPFHTCYSQSGEKIIGHRDLTLADGTKYENVWRESMKNEIDRKLNL